MNKIKGYIYSLAKENDIAIHCPKKEDVEELEEILSAKNNWNRLHDNEYQYVGVLKGKIEIEHIATESWCIKNKIKIHEFPDIKAKFTKPDCLLCGDEANWCVGTIHDSYGKYDPKCEQCKYCRHHNPPKEQTLAELLGVEEDKLFKSGNEKYKTEHNLLLKEIPYVYGGAFNQASAKETIQLYLNRHLIKQDKTPQWSEETKEQAKAALLLGFEWVASCTLNGDATAKCQYISLSKPVITKSENDIVYLDWEDDNDYTSQTDSFITIPLGTYWALKVLL